MSHELEIGDVVRRTDLSWEPLVLVVGLDEDGDRAKVALVDEPDDDTLTPILNSTVALLADTCGERARRRAVADDVAANSDVDKVWAPFDRLESLDGTDEKGCDPQGQPCETTKRTPRHR